MLAEMQRSKTQLKLADTAGALLHRLPVEDVDQYVAEAAFGALRTALRTRIRMLRIVVRVGDYKQDSYFGPGEGVVDVGPLDDDEAGLRHQLWLGTDRAYKAAAEASPPNRRNSRNTPWTNRWTTFPTHPQSNSPGRWPGSTLLLNLG